MFLFLGYDIKFTCDSYVIDRPVNFLGCNNQAIIN